MRFAINRDYGGSKTRAIILKREEDYFKQGRMLTIYYRPSIIVRTTCDWDDNEEFPVIGDTDSIQYRPKSIYVNSKGDYYYKDQNKKTRYFNEPETKLLIDWMNSSKLHLEEK